jgi:hypothetical protein
MNFTAPLLAFGFSVIAATTALAAPVTIPEGTEFTIRIEDKLSSKTAAEGDRFTITLDDDVTLSNGTVLKSGYKGVGQVTSAKENGRMGKGGELNIRLEYLRVGDSRIRLRGSRGTDGADKTGTTIALTVLFGPLGLLKKGKNVEIQPGHILTAYADSDAQVDLAAPAT